MSNPGAPALLSSSHNMQGVTTLHARRNNMQGVTFCKFLFEKSADFEVQFLALQEEIDGIFLSYIVVHGIPCVCEALAKSRHEFSQKSQSCKKLRLACSLFNMQGVTDCTFQTVGKSFSVPQVYLKQVFFDFILNLSNIWNC